MNERLAGKVVLITGAAGGIGTAIARAVTDESATVLLCDINLEGARRLADRLTGKEGLRPPMPSIFPDPLRSRPLSRKS